MSIYEYIENKNWREAISMLKTNKLLDDIDFDYVFCIRAHYIIVKAENSRLLIEDFISQAIEFGFIPQSIFQATSVSNYQLIEQLVENGHDVDEVSLYGGFTALHLAVLQQDLGLVKLLKRLKASNFIEDLDNNMPIDYAEKDSAIYNELKTSGVLSKVETELLLDDYFNAVEFSNDIKFTQTEFMAAAENGDIAKMENALGRPKGFLVLKNNWPSNGKTALHLATENNRLEAVKFLINKGLDINQPDFQGETPFEVAKRLSFTEIIELMSSHSNKTIE